jgi:hypothetical protein
MGRSGKSSSAEVVVLILGGTKGKTRNYQSRMRQYVPPQSVSVSVLNSCLFPCIFNLLTLALEAGYNPN